MTPAIASSAGEARRFTAFVVTGGVAAGVNLASRWLFSHALSYALAVTLAYIVGMATAYLLAKLFVFTTSGRHWRVEATRFAIVNAGSFAVVLAVSVALARLVLPALGWTWHAENLAHLIGVASPIALSYYAHKHFSFRVQRA